MSQFTLNHAVLLAATEAVPGEWRDLSDLLESARGDLTGLLESESISTGEASSLAGHLRAHLDAGRIAYWERQLDQLAEANPGVSILVATAPAYPVNLRSTYDRPPFLFIDGTLEPGDSLSLAVVGSRAASQAGVRVAYAVAAEAALNGVTIVSGLAAGIDSAGHQSAIRNGGRTIAVMPTGIDRIYPPGHTPLADRIRQQGCLVSQFRPGSPPTKSTFVVRNAVISGLAVASLLVEAEDRSGTRSEAEASLRHGRPVLIWEPIMGAVPWVNQFAANTGVRMVSSVREVLSVVLDQT